MKAYPLFKAAGAAFSISLLFGAAPAQAAQSYPTRPITMIVPFGPGGSADVYARILGEQLQKKFGQSVVIENKPGAGAVIGTTQVARAQPDGYTLLVMSNTQTVNETLLKDKPYNLLKDFAPIAPINEASLVLVVNNDVKATSVQDLIALAKKVPGSLNYASSGVGTPYHIAGELFKTMTGTQAQHVPYKSSGQARTGVAAGEVSYMFDATATMKPLIQAGKVRALATTGKKRSSIFPDLPTLSEAGVAGYEANIWLGLIAPKGTPQEIIDTLNKAVSDIAADPAVKERWAQDGVTPMVMNPQAFADYIKTDVARLRKIALDAKMVSE